MNSEEHDGRPRLRTILVTQIVGWLVVFGGAAYGHYERVAEETAAREAAFHSYVEEAHAEADMHNVARHIYLTGRYDDAKAVLATATEAADAAVTKAKGKVDAKALTDALPSLSLVGDTQYMLASADSLTTMAADLTAKVKAYDAEQARLKAEREAAARAAAEEAARQQAEAEQEWSEPAPSDDGGSGGGGTSAPAVDYTLYVSGSGQDQALIDACTGAIEWWSEGFVQHWSCGGSSFPEWAGAIVDIPGYGTYRVTGVLGGYNWYDESTWWVPSGAFFQTCVNGDSANTIFIGLERL